MPDDRSLGQALGGPTAERREHILGELADFISRSGPASFLAAPVVPGSDSFPEPWRRTRGAAKALLRRLAWHAGYERHAVELIDERIGAPPTERMPETRVALTVVEPKTLTFTVQFLGEDDVAGTLAHELGVVHAALHRPKTEPYREAENPAIEIEATHLERGSIAAVYLGLGVLAANAAYQQYSRSGRWNGAWNPLEYDVLRAGYIPMSELAFLLAVQAVARGGGDAPRGLEPPQRDEVTAWIAELADQRAALRERLGITETAEPKAARAVERFTDVDVDDDPPVAKRAAFRWQSHRGGLGLFLGLLLGVGIAMTVMLPGITPALLVLGSGTVGHLLGRRIRVARCTACASVIALDAPACTKCRAVLRGDVAHLSERLEAEERLELPTGDSPVGPGDRPSV